MGHSLIGMTAWDPPTAIARHALRIESETNAIAITPRLCRQHRYLIRNMNAAALQRFAQDSLFERKLYFIVCVLVVTATAGAKVAARWSNAFWRRDDNLFDLSGRSSRACLA